MRVRREITSPRCQTVRYAFAAICGWHQSATGNGGMKILTESVVPVIRSHSDPFTTMKLALRASHMRPMTPSKPLHQKINKKLLRSRCTLHKFNLRQCPVKGCRQIHPLSHPFIQLRR